MMKKQTKKSSGKAGSSFSLPVLNEALMTLWDEFVRFSCRFYLLGETARSVKQDKELKGEKIELGVTGHQLTREVLSFMTSYFDPIEIKIDDKWLAMSKNMGSVFFDDKRDSITHIRFNVKTVPVEVKVVRKLTDYFKHPDMILYNFDEFNIPNPFNKYFKVRG